MSDPSGEYRPFNDPHHPSWYSDRTPQDGNGSSAAGQGRSPSATHPQNPYAPQPLTGPHGAGQPPYPGGQYPVAGHPGAPGYLGYGDARQVGQPHPYTGYAPRSSALGIASLVCAIASLVTLGALFLPQLAAIILGHISYVREPHARGFSIAGLIIGYLVSLAWIALIVFGMSMVAVTGG